MDVVQVITAIIRREGDVFINDPADPGGPTKYGITRQTLSDWLGHPATIQSVRDLTSIEARKIYEEIYITKSAFIFITDEHLRALVVDMGVHFGTYMATKMIQSVLKVKVDGIFGIKSLTAANTQPPQDTSTNLLRRRIHSYSRQVQRSVRDYEVELRARLQHVPGALNAIGGLGSVMKETKIRYLTGWMNRAGEFI